jgi:uncharacterized protein (DUF983 family)
MVTIIVEESANEDHSLNTKKKELVFVVVVVVVGVVVVGVVVVQRLELRRKEWASELSTHS